MDKLTKYLTEPFVIEEGVNDPGILKAVFLAGGPGSGKGYVGSGLFGIPKKVNVSAYGLKLVNQDKELVRMLNKYGFGTDLDDMPEELFRQLTDPTYSDYSGLRSRAKELTVARKKLYMNGRLGLIIDGTGHKFNSIKKKKMELEEIGYDCYMVFVHTDLEIAQQRNMQRARKLDPELVQTSWMDVQKNREAFQGLFGNNNFQMVNNSDTLSEKAAQKKFSMLVKKGIGNFIRKPVKNFRGKKWIKKQQIMKEAIKLDVSVGDTILTGRFKNKKVKVKSIGKDEHGMPTINGKKIATFRTMKNVDENKDEIKTLQDFLTKYTKSAKKASAMIKKNYKKVKKQFKGDSTRDVAMALIGYDTIGENKDLFKMYTQAMKMMPGSPKQKELIKKISSLRKKLKMDEAPRIPRKKGQRRNSKKHSDLYTDENPKGTIKGLKFATVKDAKASVSKISGSGKSHAHKIQAAVAMEQRAREMGKASQAAVYRAYINKMKKKTKKKNEEFGAPAGMLPSPSRKMVKKMKRKGNTSVPYGSGYKKIKEVLDLYSKNFVASIIENESSASNLKEQKIKKVIGIYGGRFQPFHKGHLATFKWLKGRVDDAFITTSDIKQPPRHPMNFKEKVRHMVKMGIPKNRIIQEKSPYVGKNVLEKYDKDTTAVVYIFGAKDAGRLKGGKYFQDYKKNKNDLKGYEENGYVLTAPHQSVKVAGNEVSGTVMRQLLGSPNYEEDREKLFKKAFGYFDKGIYNMMTNKFKKLFEEFKLSDELIKEFLLEASGTVLSPTDDGPPTFHRGFSDYKKYSKKWLDDMYAGAGWKIVNYILGKNAINPDFDYTLSYSTVPAIAYGTKQSGEYGSRFGVDNPIEEYKKYINDTVLRNLGYEVIKWMGITPDGRNYTGVNVETPVVGGVGSDNVANTEIDKLDLKEINLDEEVKLIVEGGAYGHMNHPFDDKNLTFSDLKQIIINGLGGNLNREDNVTEKLDGQNLMISWVNGKLVTARNKGQLKNYGQTAMDTAGVASKFAGRGDIKNAFVFAMKDLSKAVGRLSAKQKEKVFGNGKRWMNLEVIYPASANVIDYDKSEIIFHGTLEYDESGRAIGQPKDSARMLAGMIKQVNQNVQKKYSIGKPVFLNVPKIQNFDSKKQSFLSRLDKLKRQFALKDNDTLGRYHQAFWEEFIFNAGKQYNYNIPNKILVNLTKRWAFFDRSYSVQNMRKEIDNEDFLDWALSFDKTDHVKYVKDNMKPFEVLFLDVGAQILKNMSGFLAASPKQAVQKIRKDVTNAIKTVKAGGDVKKIDRLRTQIEKLEKIGGMSSIVPSEGIVFKYKGNTYKFTGAFAPVNQIMGLINF